MAVLLTAWASPALAKSFYISAARVEVQIGADGALQVAEHISFAFDGGFSGAYRDIPLRAGEGVSAVQVSEGGLEFTPGAPTELGSSGAPNSFGVVMLGDRARVVWHYQAADEVRTFTVSYRMTGLTVAYDDVVDVNLQVWGDEWEVQLEQIEAVMVVPGDPQPGEVRVWGHPASVQGFTEFDADGVTPRLYAGGVPPQTFVEMRVVFPRSLLTSTSGATVRSGDGLEGILADEEAEIARGNAAAADAAAVGRSFMASLLLLIPIPFALIWGYTRFGTEPRVAYDREYEQEPPSEDNPAVIASLVSQGHADEASFTATMFDLIRRGVFTAAPVSVDRTTWGGLKKEQMSDLQIGIGDTEIQLKEYERNVVSIIGRVLEDGPQPLTEFRKHIREDAAANAASYQSFRKGVTSATTASGLLDMSGRFKGPLALIGVALVIGGLGWMVGPAIVRAVTGAANEEAFRAGTVAVSIFAGMVYAGMGVFRRLWVRRSKAGALLAKRWVAFRRYLEDFSRIEEAPPMSLPLWEQYLVYGIALGVADDVLEAARLRAPEAVSGSNLYWYGDQGFGGHSSNAISGIERALNGAFASPSASGGGGGFSGGGGGGGGGGVGGAW